MCSSAKGICHWFQMSHCSCHVVVWVFEAIFLWLELEPLPRIGALYADACFSAEFKPYEYLAIVF